MPTTRVRTKATTKATATKATTKSTKKTAAPKREAAKVDNTALAEQVGALRAEGHSIKEVAEQLNLGTGKTMFLEMVDTVSKTPKLKIGGRNDDEKAAKIVDARQKLDEYASWGWLAARSGKSEAFCRKAYTDAGHDYKGEHVASARKEARGDAPATTPKSRSRSSKAKAKDKAKDPS